MTLVRLAHCPGAQGDNALCGRKGVEQISAASAPSLLISFAYLRPWLEKQSEFAYRDWVLDSGAFTAMASGKPVVLVDYIEAARTLLARDPLLSEVFALDVIGDYRASRQNVERMWAAGIPAIPCFHQGSPWDELLGLARDYPKIALGGVARKKAGAKAAFAAECFGRVWRACGPTRIHGFGFGAREQVIRFPWHSVDSTNWELGPAGFGRWAVFGKLSVRGSAQDLRVEIEHFLRLEADAARMWQRELAKMEARSPWPLRSAPCSPASSSP